MSRILEDLSGHRRLKVFDMRSRKKQGKRVQLRIEHEHSSTVPILEIRTGKGCAICNVPTRNASNRARWDYSGNLSEAAKSNDRTSYVLTFLNSQHILQSDMVQ